MRKNNLLVFDDFILGVTSSFAVYTKDELSAPLGAYDIVAVQLVVDTPVAAAATLVVNQQHSADAKNWLQKGSTPIVSLDLTTAPPPPFSAMGADVTGVPSLAFVRFELYFTAGTPKVRVRLYATLRDQGAGSGEELKLVLPVPTY